MACGGGGWVEADFFWKHPRLVMRTAGRPSASVPWRYGTAGLPRALGLQECAALPSQLVLLTASQWRLRWLRGPGPLEHSLKMAGLGQGLCMLQKQGNPVANCPRAVSRTGRTLAPLAPQPTPLPPTNWKMVSF